MTFCGAVQCAVESFFQRRNKLRRFTCFQAETRRLRHNGRWNIVLVMKPSVNINTQSIRKTLKCIEKQSWTGAEVWASLTKIVNLIFFLPMTLTTKEKRGIIVCMHQTNNRMFFVWAASQVFSLVKNKKQTKNKHSVLH